MKRTLLTTITLAVIFLSASAQMKDPTIGGARMSPAKTIVENATNSPIQRN